MSQDTTPRPMSLEEFFARPEEVGELIEGVYWPMTAPSLRHQGIIAQLTFALMGYVKANPTGKVFPSPLDVKLAKDTVLQPDLLFISNQHLHRLTEPRVEGPPDLVIEILSPSNPRRDTVRKLALYAKYGVPEYWIVPNDFDRVEVLVLNGDHYEKPLIFELGDVLTSAVLPGFELGVASIFDQ